MLYRSHLLLVLHVLLPFLQEHPSHHPHQVWQHYELGEAVDHRIIDSIIFRFLRSNNLFRSDCFFNSIFWHNSPIINDLLGGIFDSSDII